MGGPKLVLNLPTHELDEWKYTFFFAPPETVFGFDTDLPCIFHKPGKSCKTISFIIFILFHFFRCSDVNNNCFFGVSDLKVCNNKPINFPPGHVVVLL